MLTKDRLTNLRFWRPAVVLAFTLIVAGPLQLRAAAPIQSFQLRINEKEMMLASTTYDTTTQSTLATDPAMVQHLSKDLAFQRQVMRSMPYVELMNDASSTLPITQFQMIIGATNYEFSDATLGEYALLGDTSSGMQIQSSVALGGNVLVVDILNGGLQPGDTVRFEVDLNADGDTNSLPDYRTVLLNTDPASTVSADFAGGTEVTPDVPLTGVQVSSQSTSSYTGGCCCGGSAGPLDNPYRFYGQVATVPEPVSLVLCLVGLLGGVGVRHRYLAAHRQDRA